MNLKNCEPTAITKKPAIENSNSKRAGIPDSFSHSPFINTRLQSGVIAQRRIKTVSTVSPQPEKPLKRFFLVHSPAITPLKRGANESSARRRFPFSFLPSASLLENLLCLAVLALGLLALAATTAHACGPFFPNNLLDGGDAALLSAPVADFERELARLNLAPRRFTALPVTNGFAAQTFDAEMADLAAALKQAKVSPEESARIVEGHRVNRKKLGDYLEAYDRWDSKSGQDADESTAGQHGAEPNFPSFDAVLGLPEEFADYFAGAAALRNPDAGNSFREAWERLLARPAGERKYKSTWAAFMLGRTSVQSDDDRAIEYFQQTRELAKHGFADSTGLAAASLGLEARVELRRGHFQRALELYLQQYGTGDGSAVVSLRWTAGAALAAEGEELAKIARSANERSVVTAYLICGERSERFAASDSKGLYATQAWLEAVEAAGVKDVDSAERLALAAYQEGEFELAQRWVQRAHNTPVAQWLQAKLYLRAGKVQQAAALFANAAERLPVLSTTETIDSSEFVDSLHVTRGGLAWEFQTSARVRVLAELGVLKLSRGEFEQALDALLRSGFWEDAAYVAERVLTLDELKTYVDQNWPLRDGSTNATAIHAPSMVPPPPLDFTGDIRYLLARRLTRELRSHEARNYFPTNLQARFDELVVALNAGWTESSPAAQRALALFAAAKIARADGMELLGTELAPDWHIHGGDFEDELTWQYRATNSVAALANIAGKEELRRASLFKADPEERFHYRYQAAFLAWEAAKLMPDNADETARVLVTAGSWLKNRDPDTADMFYKALVRRCRHTAIGAQADRMRWFPVLDAAGNPKPYRSRLEEMASPGPSEESPELAPNPSPAADEDDIAPATKPLPGAGYIIHKGDSILAIALAVSRLGPALTPAEILEANPGLDPARLKVGQIILIPLPGTQSEIGKENAGLEGEN